MPNMPVLIVQRLLPSGYSDCAISEYTALPSDALLLNVHRYMYCFESPLNAHTVDIEKSCTALYRSCFTGLPPLESGTVSRRSCRVLTFTR